MTKKDTALHEMTNAEFLEKIKQECENNEELWRKAEEWVLDHFDGDDLQYFLRTTD